MKVTCISAANIEVSRQHSASVHACELVRELVQGSAPLAEVDIVPLIDYEMNSCRMCGRCLETQRCARDADFNHILEKMIFSDAVFVVVPHYAPLPSKLMMLCEKMEEIAYLNWCANPDYRFPLQGKPVGVIGHGGQQASSAVLDYYQRALVEPVAGVFAALSMRVIGAGEGSPNGAVFGIKTLIKPADSVFVDIQHDWEDVRFRIAPLVHNVTAAAGLAA